MLLFASELPVKAAIG